MVSTTPLVRRLFAELLGSAFLAVVVIGSGIAAQQLSPSDVGLQLLEASAATAVGLFAIILMFGPVSGGHFNPVVSLVDANFGGLSRRDVLAYIPAQVVGCSLGAIVANGMFALQAVSISTHHRASPAHLLGEVIATFGLVLVIFALARSHRLAMALRDCPGSGTVGQPRRCDHLLRSCANDRRSNRHNPDNFVLAHSPAVRSRSRLVHHHNTQSPCRLRRRVDLLQPRQDSRHPVDSSPALRRTSPAVVPGGHRRRRLHR